MPKMPKAGAPRPRKYSKIPMVMPPLIPAGGDTGVLFVGAPGTDGLETFAEMGGNGIDGGATGAFARREMNDPGLIAKMRI